MAPPPIRTTLEAPLGKKPSKLLSDGTVVGFPGWSEHVSTDKNITEWSGWRCDVVNADGTTERCVPFNAYIQTRNFPSVDIDCTNRAAADAIAHLIQNGPGGDVPGLGVTTERHRPSSSKQLLPFRSKGGETPWHKRRLNFLIDGKKHAVEWLGKGQGFTALGRHPDGDDYLWRKPDLMYADKLP